jgi:hypothetical protein
MSARDIELARRLIAERLPHLRQPTRVCTRKIKPHARHLGQYRWLSDTMRLHPRYLAPLDDVRALELLDTVVHEILHKNSSLPKQLRDTFLPHPDVYAEAARLTRQLKSDFLRARQERSDSALSDDRRGIVRCSA